MTPLQQLHLMLAKTYTDESGENIIPKALPGLNDAEIETFRNLLPRRLPPDIEELIRFAAGIDFGGYPTIVLFTTYMPETDLSFLYTHYIDLMGDGSGNFWTLDIYSDGTWGPIYYNCHETGVIVRHSDNLTQFLQHVDEYIANPDNSYISTVIEATFNIRKRQTIPQPSKDNPVNFPEELLINIPEDHIIADLTNAPNQTGFAWGKYIRKGGTVIRHPQCPAWLLAYQKPKSWLDRLFGK